MVIQHDSINIYDYEYTIEELHYSIDIFANQHSTSCAQFRAHSHYTSRPSASSMQVHAALGRLSVNARRRCRQSDTLVHTRTREHTKQTNTKKNASSKWSFLLAALPVIAFSINSGPGQWPAVRSSVRRGPPTDIPSGQQPDDGDADDYAADHFGPVRPSD